MVLHHITDYTHLFVETSSALYAQSFGHCDLYALDVVAVPYRFQKRVRKAKVEQILDRFFAEVMIDPENRGFGEGFAERSVEFLRGRKVAAKWLFNDYPCSLVTARLGKSFRDGRKRAWRDGQVINRSRCRAERFSQIAKGRLGIVVSFDVLEFRRKRRERPGIHAAMPLKTLASMDPELVEVLRGPRHADDRHVEVSVPDHCLKCREDLLRCQIARGAKEHKRIRFEIGHFQQPLRVPISRQPFPGACGVTRNLPKSTAKNVKARSKMSPRRDPLDLRLPTRAVSVTENGLYPTVTDRSCNPSLMPPRDWPVLQRVERR